MKHLFGPATAALALLAAAPAARARTQTTDPAHPLANPQASAPDCRSDSVRGSNLPCGPTNRIEPNGAQRTPQQRK